MSIFQKYPKSILLIVILSLCFIILFVADRTLFRRIDHNKDFIIQEIERVHLQQKPIEWTWDIVKGKKSKWVGVIKLLEGEPRYFFWAENTPKSAMVQIRGAEQFLARLDENGFIMPSRRHEHPDISIAFLGGSTTENLFMKEDQRFAYLSGKLLEDKTGLKINSYNGGVCLASSFDSLQYLLHKVIPLNPNIVIFMENINDIRQFLYMQSYWPPFPGGKPLYLPRQAIPLDNKPNIARNVAVHIKNDAVSILRNLFPNIYNRYRILEEGYISPKEKRENLKVGAEVLIGQFVEPPARMKINRKQFLDYYKKFIRTLIETSKIWGILPVLMTQPNMFTENPGPAAFDEVSPLREKGITYQEFRSLYMDFNAAVIQLAREENIPCIDLAAKIPQEEQYFWECIHLNGKGSELAAQIISEELLKIVNERKIDKIRISYK